MKAAFIVAGHHLRRMVRKPGLVLLFAAIPITLALIEYAAFGPSAASGKLPPIRVLFLDEDASTASRAVPQFFAGGPMKDYFELTPVKTREDAKAMFQQNTASALIVVPNGFQDALLNNRGAKLQLYKNPIQNYSPEVVDSVLEMGAAIGNGLISRAREPLEKIRALADARKNPTEDYIAEISRGFYRAARSFSRLGALQDISVTVQRPSGSGKGIGADPKEFLAYIFPGLMLFGLLFISEALALRLLRDRTTGLQRRVVMTPASRGAVLAGSVLYMITGLLVLLALLGLIGSLIFRIQLRQPMALLALGLGFAVFATGLQLSITALARSDRAAQAVASVIVVLLSLVGGSFLPAENFPASLRTLAHIVPNGAAQQGLIDVLVHKRALGEISARVATVWIWAAVMLVVAMVAERRRMIA